jgi:hypothetical protein
MGVMQIQTSERRFGEVHAKVAIPGAFASMFGTVPAVDSLRRVALNTKDLTTLKDVVVVLKWVRDRVSDDGTQMRDSCARALISAVKNPVSDSTVAHAAFIAGLAMRGNLSSESEADLAIAIRDSRKADYGTRKQVNEYILTSTNIKLIRLASNLDQAELPMYMPDLRVFEGLRR